jgi:pimeloyl-ACP methyl ester carboxylesterase
MPFRIRVTVAILLALLGALILAPLIVPIADLEGTVPARQLAGADSRFVEVGGLAVHYRETGSGADSERPALVFLHGFGNNLASWRKVVAPLSVYGRAIAIDRVAFGLSEHPPAGSWRGLNPYSLAGEVVGTLAVLDALGVGRAVLVGSSSGGALAAQIALDHPERVAGLVLASPAILEAGGPPAWSRPLLFTPQLQRIGPLFMRQFGGASGENVYRAAWSNPDRIGEDDLAAYRLPLQADGWDRALWELTKASHRPEVAAHLEEITVPTLVLAGAGDVIVPTGLSAEVARRLPNGVLALFDDCGHLPHEECPQSFLTVVEDWLSTTLAAAAP